MNATHPRPAFRLGLIVAPIVVTRLGAVAWSLSGMMGLRASHRRVARADVAIARLRHVTLRADEPHRLRAERRAEFRRAGRPTAPLSRCACLQVR